MDVWSSIEENVIIVKAGIIFLRLSGTIKAGVTLGRLHTLGTFPAHVRQQFTLWDYYDSRIGRYYNPSFNICYYKNGNWLKYSCGISKDGTAVSAWIGNDNAATEFYIIGTVRKC